MTQHLPSPFTIFPRDLLNKVNEDFWNFNDTKFSYAELSHRSQNYVKVNEQSMAALKQYLKIPNNYHVLYLPAGCGHPALPFNLITLTNHNSIYIVNDSTSSHAYQESLKINPKTKSVTHLEQRVELSKQLSQKPFYFYTFYSKLNKETGEITPQPEPLEGEILVCSLDNCQTYLEIDISKHGIVMFQTGHGTSMLGMNVMIVRKDLFGTQLSTCPDMLCFEKTLTANSVINTPCTLIPLLILKQLQFLQSQEIDQASNRHKLATIKQQFEDALKQVTQVAQSEAQGFVKFKLPPNTANSQAEQYGKVEGQWLILMLQQSNIHTAHALISRLFE